MAQAEGDRDVRLEQAVQLVQDCKYSVRKAAHALSLPKSTVHRYLQANRANQGGVGKRRRTSPSRPAKCDIAFLLHDAPKKEKKLQSPPSSSSSTPREGVPALSRPVKDEDPWKVMRNGARERSSRSAQQTVQGYGKGIESTRNLRRIWT